MYGLRMAASRGSRLSSLRRPLVRPLLIAPLVAAFFLVWMMLPNGEAYARAGAAPHRSASLVVRVSGLPPNVSADIALRGPGLLKTLTGSRTVSHLRPGRYTFTVRQVTISAGHHVRAGSLALPAVARQSVQVNAGHRVTVTLQYGTIINPNVQRLRGPVLSVKGNPENPTGLVLSARAHVHVGTILTATPSSQLPAGLFHAVTAVRRSGQRLVVTLKPAQLTEAFPQLDINANVALSTGKAVVGQGQAAAFEPLTASLGIGDFSCQLPLASSQLSAQQSLSIDADVQIHIPTFFGIPVGLPDGKLALTLKASAALDAVIQKDTGCSASVTLPPLPGAIPVGPVVIPVYAQVGVLGSATIAANLQVHASAGLSLTAGMEFHGTSIHNISGASANASASASGEGTLSVGPSIRFAVGVADVADVHLDATPALAFTVALSGSCSLDLVAGSQVGISIGPFELNQSLPAPTDTLYRCPQPATTQLSISQSAPPGAFPGQEFNYTISLTNNGSATAHEVNVVDTLPGEGTFVSSSPSGTSSGPAPGSSYTIPIGDLSAGQTATVTIRWSAPASPTTITNSAVAQASNAPQAGPATAIVPVGTTGNCNPCGSASAGTGLRNRDRGTITIAGIPPGAVVTRAVLVWGILYGEEVPSNMITFDGHPTTANLTSSISGTLCWGDTATIGYAADVTPYVSGNGTYEVTEPPRGETRVDEDPYGPLPYTDGASLVVFYNGGGADNQVLSDFSYNTNTDPTTDDSITRSFSGINSVGGPASLMLAGPDGQSNYGKIFTFTGAGEQVVEDPFVGSAPQEGPSFPIGNLWDNEVFDVSSILPAGQQTLTFNNQFTEDCIGVGAAVLQVAQSPG
jgi:uncharacterized repeat protein (TIGR01451 family)